MSSPEIKIIHAGMHRSGSASISQAIEELGFGPSSHLVTLMTGNRPEIAGAIFGYTAKTDLLRKINNSEENANFDEL